ncbi:MAG: hypothetical protein MJ137_08855 [Clostridia bacterium]|nr:hypothetical protein [Clostridia bacterium]
MKLGRILSGIAAVLSVLLLAALCFSCSDLSEGDETVNGSVTEKNTEETVDREEIMKRKYKGPFAAHTGTLAGTDALGRVLPLDITAEERADGVSRSVGIFYFLWMGQHGTGGPYDNSIISEIPGATESEAAWKAAGGGNVGETHFWGKPMFGYYTTNDKWVMRKHIQMLADAGIDYVIFDTTNAYIYEAQALSFLSLLKEFDSQGYKVPKAAFYTNSSSGKTMNEIYERIYKAHPEYEKFWFTWDGKPMIIGVSKDPEIKPEVREFFRIKESQWPNSGKKDDGFPWMEFDRLLTPSAVYGLNGVKEILNVSPAQHNKTCTMSATAFYGANDRTRSFSPAANANLTTEEAFLSGVNFAAQWEWALKQDVRSIFVTGWNEWGAQRQPSTLNPKYPIYFVDCCTPNTSRDVEPMEGGFGDNYYMQMIDGIRRFKGTDGRVDIGGYRTVDIADENAFEGATAVYRDYAKDSIDRASVGFGSVIYNDMSGLNDFVSAAVLRDRDYLYFEVTCSKTVFKPSDERRMTLFIRCGDESASGEYTFAVNRGEFVNGCAVLEQRDGDKWKKIGECETCVSGRRMAVKIDRSLMGIRGTADGDTDLVSIEFKWADGYTEDDVFSFYKSGDCAPMGRLNYLYSNIAG